jgi:esterase
MRPSVSEHSLHVAHVRAPGATPRETALFLHGILGSGSNLRSLAQALVQASSTTQATLVDLRLHGRSKHFAAPHDVHACATDLTALAAQLALPVKTVVGHSFGGKVALAYHESVPALDRLVLLDSYPGVRADRVGSEDTMAVVAMLARLPRQYARREQFIEQVHAEGHSRMVADWLAMNLSRSGSGFELDIDLPGIEALLDSYFSLDLWPVLERSSARIDVVIGGRSRVWNADDRTRIRELAAHKPNLHVHVLPEAGHWVHVDGAETLRNVLFTQPAR